MNYKRKNKTYKMGFKVLIHKVKNNMMMKTMKPKNLDSKMNRKQSNKNKNQ